MRPEPVGVPKPGLDPEAGHPAELQFISMLALAREVPGRDDRSFVRALDDARPGQAAGAVDEHIRPDQIADAGARPGRAARNCRSLSRVSVPVVAPVSGTVTDVDPLMPLPLRSNSRPPTQPPICRLAPAWIPPTKPLESMPVIVMLPLTPWLGSVNGSCPQRSRHGRRYRSRSSSKAQPPGLDRQRHFAGAGVAGGSRILQNW